MPYCRVALAMRIKSRARYWNTVCHPLACIIHVVVYITHIDMDIYIDISYVMDTVQCSPVQYDMLSFRWGVVCVLHFLRMSYRIVSYCYIVLYCTVHYHEKGYEFCPFASWKFYYTLAQLNCFGHLGFNIQIKMHQTNLPKYYVFNDAVVLHHVCYISIIALIVSNVKMPNAAHC